ncbi:MAG TPA: PAS domain S-box protein [Planctomycetota bacterium]|nr:PAS domain S-box protein [Planctomycetota bacterium]
MPTFPEGQNPTHDDRTTTESKLRLLAERIPVMTWMRGAGNPSSIWFNKAWLEFRGRTLEEERAERWTGGVHPDDLIRCVAAHERAFEGREQCRGEYRLQRHDGVYRCILDTAAPLFTEGGAFAGHMGSCVDITELWDTEAVLKANEERYRSLVAATTSVVWTTDAGGAFVAAQPAWEAYTGQTWVMHRGWGWTQAIHPDDREAVKALWTKAIKEGTSYESQGRVWNEASREHRYFVARGVPIFNEDGSVREWIGTITDVHERREAEQNRRDAEGRFRHLATKAPMGIVFADAGGSCVYVNERWCHLTELTADAAMGEGWLAAVHPDDRDRVSAGWKAAVKARREHILEFRFQTSTGKVIHVESTAVALNGQGADVTGYMCIVLDVTERKRAELQRGQLLEDERRARVEAERASHLKDEFLSTLSHELRSPLSAILGWTRLIRDGKLGPEEGARGLETIERNVQVQTQLIEDLLDMSRIVSGKLRVQMQRVDLLSVIEAAIGSALPAAEAKGIRIQKVLDTEGGLVMGDPGRLQQVFWNLFSNAIKFTPRGGKVQVTLQRVESYVEVQVTDTGQGIHADFLPHVFEQFCQADGSTTRKHGGLGLGLSIVRNLVELHAGAVHARSPGEGRGATFKVLLPLLAVHEEPESSERLPLRSPSAPRASTPPTLGGITVLVVDDEPDSRDVIKRLLEAFGAKVTTAPSAAVALQALQRDRPAVIVSDIGMPGEDGYAFIKKVRSLLPAEGGTTPAVALTAYARSEDRSRALLSGFQLHLSKPVEPMELITVVATVSARGMKIAN